MPADTLYWDGTGTSWESAASWSTGAFSDTPDPLAPPRALDVATFNTVTNQTPQTVFLDGSQSVLGLFFSSSGSVLLQGGISDSLSIGPSGITIGAAAGPAAIAATVFAPGAQTWTNNSAGVFIVDRVSNIAGLTVTGNGDFNFAGATSGNTFTKSGAGKLTFGGALDNAGLGLNVTAGTVVLAKSSNASVHAVGGGGLAISGGTVQLAGGGGDQIYDHAHVSMSGGTLDLNGKSESFDGLSGAGGTITNTSANPSTLTVGLFSTGGVFGGNVADGAGAVALTKTGTAELILTGANTYSGATTINQGTLRGSNTNALSPNSTVTVAAGATLNIGGVNQTIGALAGAGNVTTFGGFGHTDTLAVGANNASTTFSGVISNAPSTRGVALNKVGTGTLTLSSANTFTGGVTVTQGTLRCGHPEALGTLNLNVFVLAGATLDVGGQTLAPQGFRIQGTGVAGAGALINASGTPATLTGFITLDANATVGGFGDITVDAPVFQNVLTKAGIGKLTLAGSSDNVGLGLTVSNGTVVLAKQSSSGVHAVGGPGVTANGGTLQLAGTGDDQIYDNAAVTLNGGTFDLNGRSEAFDGLSGNGGAITNTSANPSTLTVGLFGAGGTLASAIQAGAGTLHLTKAGAGTLTLSGNNTYTGLTTVSQGTLRCSNPTALGSTAGGTVVASGATLDLGGQTLGTEPITIQGAGVGGAGALVNSSGVPSTAAGTITLSGPATVGGAGDITLSGDVRSNTLTKAGLGKLTFSGSADNASLGLVVTAGTVVLAKQSGSFTHAVGGTGVTLSAGTVQLAGSGGDQLFDPAGLTINAGTFDLNGRNETVNQLYGAGGVITNTAPGTTATLTVHVNGVANSDYAGAIQDGAGATAVTKSAPAALFLGGANTYSGATAVQEGSLIAKGPNTFSASSAVTVAAGATLDLAGYNQTIASLAGAGCVTSDTPLSSHLTLTAGGDNATTTFSGQLSSDAVGGSLTLRKVGVGTLTLGGAAHNAGVVAIDAAAGTVVLAKASSPAVHATGNVAVNGGTVRLDGTGGDQIADNAFLVLDSGTLDLNGRNESVGTLTGAGGTITNTAPATTATLTVGAPGSSSDFSGAIGGGGAGTVALTKTGVGTLTLYGANTYSGITTIQQGTLRAGQPNTLSQNSRIDVQAGAVLEIGTGSNQAIGSLTGAGTVRASFAGGTDTLTIGSDNSSPPAFSGMLTDSAFGRALALTKVGVGTQILSGPNAYDGPTRVNQGTLKLGHPTALGFTTGATIVAAGATLDLNGQAIGNEPLNLSGAGVGSAGALINSSLTPASAAGNVFISAGATIGGTGGITLGGNLTGATLSKTGAATLTLGPTTLTGNLAVAGGTVRFAPKQSFLLFCAGLSVAPGATLDLTSNTLLVSTTAASHPALISLLAAAYHAGRWDLPGITSSAAASDAFRVTGVGYSISGGTITFRYTWLGDLNLDGFVNATDTQMLAAAASLPPSTQFTWAQGDLNLDRRLSADDFALFAQAASIAANRHISTVPEPAVPVAPASLLFFPRRRKKSAS